MHDDMVGTDSGQLVQTIEALGDGGTALARAAGTRHRPRRIDHDERPL
ncbi:hypothetical protein [Streptomyces albicerus]|nr:hypothetical protein [Streptomyces albicerus]